MTLQKALETALQKRQHLIQEPYNTAFRLCNGFLEGLPKIVIEVFGKTLVIHDHNPTEEQSLSLVPYLQEKLPWIDTALLKKRKSKKAKEQSGKLLFGENPDTEITENSIRYAINPLLNQDASFYLDTENLRTWLVEQSKGKTILNTFAYTGSLGIAALAGGAEKVTQLDLNPRFLSLAKQSLTLNDLDPEQMHCDGGDFWTRMKHYKLTHQHFDCVILDPPFFSKTDKGTIDISKNFDSLINKVRPLINHNGTLITIHNALFQSGKDHQEKLQSLCNDYLSIEEILPIPEHCIGNQEAVCTTLPADPSPYNYSTKITIFRIKRKDKL